MRVRKELANDAQLRFRWSVWDLFQTTYKELFTTINRFLVQLPIITAQRDAKHDTDSLLTDWGKCEIIFLELKAARWWINSLTNHFSLICGYGFSSNSVLPSHYSGIYYLDDELTNSTRDAEESASFLQSLWKMPQRAIWTKSRGNRFQSTLIREFREKWDLSHQSSGAIICDPRYK